MNSERGFILVEVLLSLAIIGAVFAVFFQGISAYVRSTSSSQNYSIAALLSQQLIARIHLNEFKDGINKGTFGDDYPTFSWKVERTVVSDGERRYDAAVMWDEKRQEKEFKIITARGT